ncbi:VOC family protein [Rhodococcus sp. USK13]|jgi:catechol 2,3-dioxygenase-like lactoylglutathione lyase family enzyme|uniref:VOC family protein n=1 Tax=Rhodococcus sp. USK13 TaxID=2806442 RepID=UPI001BCAB726|nr:VOC family protein [Rhodococcus sp. USK13]
MTPPSTIPKIRAQPLVSVADVERAADWYCHVLGAVSGHGGCEYEQLLVDGVLILQLHRIDLGHHHGALCDPALPRGNGVAIWFEAGDFDDVLTRIRVSDVDIVTDVHFNPNAGHREIWLRDLDGYLVVIAESSTPSA